ncbi:hypothetical protein RJ639_044219 [Escallonia herrerae]|uniref:Reverse transcriptase/retrotransposon-derived protein RNase H-like domain-containing protein n=1 Tax=Escallonia herrerae TaxID=1293975 RepID=A0AA88WFI9_9ASTE|nr:hypothetical protein RJ639_044219 [Escallonia herrerae]
MEHYFEGASITDEKAKVRTATVYLTDTATLWWPRKHNDIEKGLCTIDTWDVFKKEIKRQFYPDNVTYEARKKLRELKHKSSIHDYVKERFIKGYSAKAAPLTDLLKKGKVWEWSKRCQIAFDGLKEAVTEEPVLALPDYTKLFELQTDASEFAIGGLTPSALAGDYKGRSPLAAQVARSWNEKANVARSYLDKAACRMKKWADKRRRPKEYNLGDMVMLKLLLQELKSFRRVHKGLIRNLDGYSNIASKVAP